MRVIGTTPHDCFISSRCSALMRSCAKMSVRWISSYICLEAVAEQAIWRGNDTPHRVSAEPTSIWGSP